MPSVHQHAGADSTDYGNEVTKMVATKNLETVEALLRGLDHADAVHAYLEAELDLAEAEARDPRTDIIALVNRRLAAVRP